MSRRHHHRSQTTLGEVTAVYIGILIALPIGGMLVLKAWESIYRWCF